MTTTVMDDYILPVLVRYIDQYGWSFPFAARLINMYFGTGYTHKDLRALHKRKRAVS